MSNARFEVVDGIRMKVLGRPCPPLMPEQALAWNFEWLQLAHPAVRNQPRGVFRFRNWEEFNQWKTACLMAKT